MGMGGKVGEGHRGASGAEDGAWLAMCDRVSKGGGQRGGMAGRGAGAWGGAMGAGPMGRDRGGGWEGEQSEGSGGTGGYLWSPILPYRAGERERDRPMDRGISCFGIRSPHPRSPHRRPANRTRHRAT